MKSVPRVKLGTKEPSITSICKLSCKGLSEDGKLTDTSYSETQLRKRFLENSKTRVFLITKNKIGKKYIHTLCTTKEVDYIVTDDDGSLTSLR